MITINWLLVLLGLFLGTYLVRAIPFWWNRLDALPGPLQRFLELVPAAAIGALIFPDVFFVSELWIAIGTVAAAFFLTVAGLQLTLVVLLTVLGAWAALGLG